MKLSVFTVLLSLICQQVDSAYHESSKFCPDFSATITVVSDQTISSPEILIADPELIFLKEVMNFRDNTIRHEFEDAIQFFNDTYGLDFSLSPQSDNNEYFFENAKLSPFKFADETHYLAVFSNWIRTGNTLFTCRDVHEGGIHVTFSGSQLLRGSYGGVDGVLVGDGNVLLYGYAKIDVCEQSPVTIQFQSASPLRQEPLDGATFINCDIYHSVLGYGKALGLFTVKQDLENAGKFRLVHRNVLTFPAV